MTTEEALLAAIWASPHDDLPRLVYADFLEETDDPAKVARAEFIRVQCELAKLSGREDEQWVPLKMAESRLLKQFGDEFRRELPSKIRKERFHRGFVAPQRRVIVLDYPASWSAEKLDRAPLWEFHVNYRNPELVFELLRSSQFRRLSFLGIWEMSDEQAFALAESPNAVNLTGLDFRVGTVTAAGVRAIARSPHLPHVRELVVSLKQPHRLDVVFARELADSPLSERLRVLDVFGRPHMHLAAEELLWEKFRDQLVIRRQPR